ncbi:hypothetical protein [uncultured Aquimarina sp.]|uniref:hypothetical protein n=1 Tax=uncultured Aquimarina sp. TaxID=575652 RepID=UPI00260E6A06|nr:hypothetical protein [uncultured Aquimarina sp.]
MNSFSLAHIFCYVTVVVVFFCGLFFGNTELIFIKPISSLTLIWVYFENREKVNFLYPLVIIIIMVNDVFVLSDFDRFFNYIGVLLSSYYLVSSYLLMPFISFKDIRYKEMFSPSVLIGLLLVIYLAFSIFNLTMPNLESSIVYGIMIIVSLFYFLGCNFIIYLRNRYTHSYYLLIAASSCILVNALVPIQELYYRNSIFEAVIYSADIIAMLFYLKFLISAEPIEENIDSNFI